MPSIVTQGSEARLLQEGINAVATIEYKDYEMEYSKIFTVTKSDKAYELDVSLSGMGLAALKPEGTSIGYDAEKQDFTTTYTHAVYGLGTIITMEAQMNNLKRDLIQKAGKLLKRSLVHTDEQLAANVINNGYDSSYLLGDGVALFSTAHVLGKGGTFSNRFTVFTPLSQAAVEDATIAIEDYRDGAGLLINAKAVSLHIPRQLRYTADRILASRFEPNSANTATVNPVAGIFPGGYHVNHRFTSGTEWFIKTDVDDGFKIFNRMDYTFDQDNDFGTSNYRHKGMFYKSYGVTDPRCAYGSGQ
tara:strand:- start:497 stop:1405 length:909 start_codon:yes stop_codon:yes gene_type:complete